MKIRNRTLLMIILALIIMLSVVISAKMALGDDYYVIGPGYIKAIYNDIDPNNLVVISDDSILVIRADDGEILQSYDVYSAECIAPDTDYIYGAGFSGNGKQRVFSILRSNGSIEYTDYGETVLDIVPSFLATVIVFDENRIYVINEFQGLGGSNYPPGRVYVFSKQDLTQITDWECSTYPSYCVLDENGSMFVPDGMTRAANDSGMPFSFYDPDTYHYSKLCEYDTNRDGMLLGEAEVLGSVTHFNILGNGVKYACISKGPFEWLETPTLYFFTDPVLTFDIEDWGVATGCVDANTNRIFCALIDESDTESEPLGEVLVWDYETSEYYIVDTGIEYLVMLAFANGKLFGADGRDNKLYNYQID